MSISAWFYPESENSGAIVTRMVDDVTEQENGLPKGRGYGVFFVNGKVHFNLVGVWADDSFRVETEETLPARQWHHVVAMFDSLQPYEKVQLYVDGQKRKLKVNNGRLFRQFSVPKGHLLIGGGGGPAMALQGDARRSSHLQHVCPLRNRFPSWPAPIPFPRSPRSRPRHAARGSA